jgi:hypothetical protein
MMRPPRLKRSTLCGTQIGLLVRRTVYLLRRASVAAIVAVGILVSPSATYASCYEFAIEREFATARAVFLGRVVRSEVVRTGPGPVDVETVTSFTIKQSWKGPGERSMTVTSCGGGDVACTSGIAFIPGRDYLVFASGERLETSSCEAFKVEKAATSLAWLRRRPSRTPR